MMNNDLIGNDTIAKRKQAYQVATSIFAVDNLRIDDDAKHIIEDYCNGTHATVEDAVKALDDFFSVKR